MPGALPLLMLYGSTLKSLRVGKSELDADLQAQGVTRLLRKGWRGDARLVLTTYETMRDLEFAMASQPWSVMVCDEGAEDKDASSIGYSVCQEAESAISYCLYGDAGGKTPWLIFGACLTLCSRGMLGALSHFSRTLPAADRSGKRLSN